MVCRPFVRCSPRRECARYDASSRVSCGGRHRAQNAAGKATCRRIVTPDLLSVVKIPWFESRFEFAAACFFCSRLSPGLPAAVLAAATSGATTSSRSSTTRCPRLQGAWRSLSGAKRGQATARAPAQSCGQPALAAPRPSARAPHRSPVPTLALVPCAASEPSGHVVRWPPRPSPPLKFFVPAAR